MPTLTEQPNGSARIKSADQPDEPQGILDLASDQLRVSGALAIQDRIKDKRFLEAITNAEAKAVYGNDFKLDEADPVVAIDSKFETHHHAAPAPPTPPVQPAPQPKPLPAWAKVAAIVAALAGTGAGGALIANALNKPGGAATTPEKPSPPTTEPGKSKSYQLDFW